MHACVRACVGGGGGVRRVQRGGVGGGRAVDDIFGEQEIKKKNMIGVLS